nr:hypothetical protein [Halomicroarcula rubra]
MDLLDTVRCEYRVRGAGFSGLIVVTEIQTGLPDTHGCKLVFGIRVGDETNHVQLPLFPIASLRSWMAISLASATSPWVSPNASLSSATAVPTPSSMTKFISITFSKDYRVRLFYFVFAVLLYNIWRLTDFLLKAGVDDEMDYAPVLTTGECTELVVGKTTRSFCIAVCNL